MKEKRKRKRIILEIKKKKKKEMEKEKKKRKMSNFCTHRNSERNTRPIKIRLISMKSAKSLHSYYNRYIDALQSVSGVSP